MKKILKRMWALMLIGVTILSNVTVFAQDNISNWDGITRERVYETDEYRITFSLSSYWDTGYNAEIKIENYSSIIIENWYLSFEYDGVISNIWNAEIVDNKNNEYIVKNADWNEDIAVGGSVSFGISGNTAFVGYPEKFEFVETIIEAEDDDYSVNYVVDSDWGSGFCSTVTINNKTDKVLEDWVLEFDYEREIEEIWNGKIILHEDNHYVIKNSGYNSDISENGSVSFGIKGSMGESEDKPFDFKLYTYGLDDSQDETEMDYETDSDSDNVPDYIEEYFETDCENPDTDSDGLSDYMELYVLSLDPTKIDTDSDGINDADEDSDSDGLSNNEEIYLGTELTKADTDLDGLSDYDEVEVYKTDVLDYDTDDDAVSDGDEIRWGTNPNILDESFKVVKMSDEEDSVTASVEIELSGSQIETLTVEANDNTTFFPADMPGYLGKAYDFNVNGEFDSAVISFKFDESLLGEDADPTIYYFNEKDQILEELNTKIVGNTASTVVEHFSTYILIDRKIYNNSFRWEDVWDSEASYSDVEIVIVIDDSGSMSSNDKNDQRLVVAKDLIDKLPEGAKIGVVKFASNVKLLTSKLTVDKSLAKSYLTSNYFSSSGNTYMYRAISQGFDLYESTDKNVLKIMIVLSDGNSSETSKHNSTILTANKNDVNIFTVGLGSSSSRYFINYLQPLAEQTGGTFYLADDADGLVNIFENINKKIDIITDTDGDSIPDYYEDNMVGFNGKSIKLDKYSKDTDADGLDDNEEISVKLKYNEDKTKVYVSGVFISDPTLVDSDYDGTDDCDEISQEEIFDNSITSRIYYSINENILQPVVIEKSIYKADINFSMDYRWFFGDDTQYSKDLSVLGSLLVNDMYDAGYMDILDVDKVVRSTNEKDKSVGDGVSFQEILGLEKICNYDAHEILNLSMNRDQDRDDVTEFTVGHREVTYNNTTKEIIILALRGTNGTSEEWSSNFDVGADSDEYYQRTGEHADWSNTENHKGFDVAATRVLNAYNSYLQLAGLDNDNTQKCIFIVGHSRAAAIANILGTYFENDDSYDSFVYTYATPYTTTVEEEEEYSTIFNIVNTDDIVTYLPLADWGFRRYGTTKDISVKEEYEVLGKGEKFTLEGSFEYLFKEDYNSNGQLESTMDAFTTIGINNREELYILDESDDGTVIMSIGYILPSIAKLKMGDLKKELAGEKLLKFCELKVDTRWNGSYISCNYCPAYLLQTLANMVEAPTDKLMPLGRPMNGVYADVKSNFVLTSGKLYFGGMANPHMPPTYYLIAENNFRKLTLFDLVIKKD